MYKEDFQMANKTSFLVSAAITGLLAASGYGGLDVAQASGDHAMGQCHGVNACKGHGDCQGKGHECSGKNSCEGKGWVKLSQETCEKLKDGKWTPMPKKDH